MKISYFMLLHCIITEAAKVWTIVFSYLIHLTIFWYIYRFECTSLTNMLFDHLFLNYNIAKHPNKNADKKWNETDTKF